MNRSRCARSTLIGLCLALVLGSSAQGDPPPRPCTLDDKLVPTCGILWGAAPAAYSDKSEAQATRDFEAASGGKMDVYHAYHRAPELVPTAAERRLAEDPDEKRLLMINYKPSMIHTWREIADGAVDAELQRLAAHIKSTYDEPFFFVIWHEPENDVVPTPGSGMEASDFADMFRHVVTTLRAAGADKLVFVMNYQGYPAYSVQPWYDDLWPGSDVVDWIASDSYNTGQWQGWNSGDFRALVNRKKGTWRGFYDHMSELHPDKPLMLAEWGLFNAAPGRAAWFYDRVRQQLPHYPRLKAMLYFNSEMAPKGRTAIDATYDSRAAYRRLTSSLDRVTIQ